MSWYTDIKTWIANNIRTNHQREITGAKMNTVLNDIVDEVENKVDKVEGKGLSTNDYTDTDKAKVTSALQTETDPTVPSWAKQSTKPSYDYSEIENTPDLSGFITKSVNDLANYYLKSETYTKTEVTNLIAAVNQFHYEIAASTSAVTNPQSNVLYLIGPVGSGSDKYEEYVYPDSTTGWVKIGDTSIDLSGYVTTSALNTALAAYTNTSDLTTLLSGKQDTISDLSTIRSGAAAGATAVQPSEMEEAIEAVNPFAGVVDATDAERLQALANVSNQTANSITGKMGYKVLDPTKTFTEQVTAENTIYEIRDVFEVGSVSVPFTMPNGSTIKFNGGKINGNVIGDFDVAGEISNKTVFSNGYNMSKSNYLTASEIGMIPNDETKAQHNGNIFSILVNKEKSIYLDGTYYIAGTHNIDYDLTITGGRLITTNPTFLVPLSNSSITIKNCSINARESIIYKENINYLIDKIEISNCIIERAIIVRLYDNDQDVSQNTVGINEFYFLNNICEKNIGSQIVVHLICYKECQICNNIIREFAGFASIGRGNGDINLSYFCDIHVENNIANGIYIKSGYSSYSTFLLAIGKRVFYRNNTINNLVKSYHSGYPAYDAYVTADEYYCENNKFKNIVYVPIDGTYTEGDAHSEMFKSKMTGSKRIARNNTWEFDFTEIKSIILAGGDTITDEQLANVSDVGLFEFEETIDYVEFSNNTVSIKGGRFRLKSSSTPVKTWIIKNNKIYADSVENTLLFPSYNSVCRMIRVENNEIDFSNAPTSKYINLFNNYSSDGNINVEIIAKNNRFSRNIFVSCNKKIKRCDIRNNEFFGNFSTTSTTNLNHYCRYEKVEKSFIESEFIGSGDEQYIIVLGCKNMIGKINCFIRENKSNEYIPVKWSSSGGNDYYNFDLKISMYGYSKIFFCRYVNDNGTIKCTMTDERGLVYLDNNTTVISGTIINKGNFKIDFASVGYFKVYNNTSNVEQFTIEYADADFKYFAQKYEMQSTSNTRPSLPNNSYKGYLLFDTTLGKYICWNGTDWVNLDGTALS